MQAELVATKTGAQYTQELLKEASSYRRLAFLCTNWRSPWHSLCRQPLAGGSSQAFPPHLSQPSLLESFPQINSHRLQPALQQRKLKQGRHLQRDLLILKLTLMPMPMLMRMPFKKGVGRRSRKSSRGSGNRV